MSTTINPASRTFAMPGTGQPHAEDAPTSALRIPTKTTSKWTKIAAAAGLPVMAVLAVGGVFALAEHGTATTSAPVLTPHAVPSPGPVDATASAPTVPTPNYSPGDSAPVDLPPASTYPVSVGGPDPSATAPGSPDVPAAGSDPGTPDNPGQPGISITVTPPQSGGSPPPSSGTGTSGTGTSGTGTSGAGSSAPSTGSSSGVGPMPSTGGSKPVPCTNPKLCVNSQPPLESFPNKGVCTKPNPLGGCATTGSNAGPLVQGPGVVKTTPLKP